LNLWCDRGLLDFEGTCRTSTATLLFAEHLLKVVAVPGSPNLGAKAIVWALLPLNGITLLSLNELGFVHATVTDWFVPLVKRVASLRAGLPLEGAAAFSNVEAKAPCRIRSGRLIKSEIRLNRLHFDLCSCSLACVALPGTLLHLQTTASFLWVQR
jgi:hypothetical protein